MKNGTRLKWTDAATELRQTLQKIRSSEARQEGLRELSRKLLALGAILALSVVALVGSAGVAQASKGDNNGATVIPFFDGCNFIFNHGHGFLIGCD